jgi:RimJ/RimL family protein N-acetyltransferase
MKDTPMVVEPVTLQGQYIRLEPLKMEHFDSLWSVGQDPELWKWTAYKINTPEKMRTYLRAALDGQELGVALPFVTIWQATDEIVGSTRFGNIDAPNHRVEIGWTWIGKPWQRTPVNTEAKFLMLKHAFEVWQCIRVELKTDKLNTRSREAILRLGAKEEGIFRHHMITDSGRLRDTVYFSIIDDEWPDVKARLQALLARPWTHTNG